MPKQYFDQHTKCFDHQKKYFVDNEQSPKPKEVEVSSSVISRDFTPGPSSRHSAHITVDDRGDTVTGGVSVRDIEDFRDWAKTRIRDYELRTVPPKGVVGLKGKTGTPTGSQNIYIGYRAGEVVTPSGIKPDDLNAAFGKVSFGKDGQVALNNAPLFKGSESTFKDMKGSFDQNWEKGFKQIGKDLRALNKAKQKRTRKPLPKPPKTSFTDDVLDLIGMRWFREL